MSFEEKTLNQTYLYKGRILNLRVDEVMLSSGRHSKREVVEHPGGACVLALNERGNVLLVQQYRYPYGKELLELPAGKLDHGAESASECAGRELVEETGYRAE